MTRSLCASFEVHGCDCAPPLRLTAGDCTHQRNEDGAFLKVEAGLGAPPRQPTTEGHMHFENSETIYLVNGMLMCMNVYEFFKEHW